MSSAEYVGVEVLSAAVGARAVRAETLSLAVLRDLGRFDRALDGGVTEVRRQALSRHLMFVLDQVAAQQRWLADEVWPSVADRVGGLDEVSAGWAELRPSLVALRSLAAQWAGLPSLRTKVRSAVRDLVAELSVVVGRELAVLPSVLAVLSDDEWARAEVARRSRESRVPTAVARRVFWLLDSLDEERADVLLRGTRPYRLWILRNGFSGGYNRSSFLMWVGGGSGPSL